MVAPEIFSMYTVKHTNVICVTRNADLDTAEESDEYDEDFRSHMQRILKKRGRLAPVRLESERPLSYTTDKFLREKLGGLGTDAGAGAGHKTDFSIESTHWFLLFDSSVAVGGLHTTKFRCVQPAPDITRPSAATPCRCAHTGARCPRRSPSRAGAGCGRCPPASRSRVRPSCRARRSPHRCSRSP